jgi:hypothetical protein
VKGQATRALAVGAACAALTVAFWPSVAQAEGATKAPAPVVVTTGLNNPRQLSLTRDGTLLVAEAGKGGSACSTDPDEGTTCIGATGSVSAVFLPAFAHNQKPKRIVTGLLSGAGADGSFAAGPDGVSAQSILGPIYVQETFAPPDVIPQGLPGDQSGKLLRAGLFRPAKVAADISAFEAAHDPDGQGVASNPYAVLDLGNRQLVADAAGNDVLQVNHGSVSLFHKFPNITSTVCTTPDPTTGATGFDPTPAFPGCNFVPTALAVGPHGDIFVGGLGSEVPGQGEVVELSPRGTVERTWTGFTSVDGVAVAGDGTVYVSQLEAPEANPINPMVVGVVTKISRSGKQTNVDVPFPAGIAVDRFGNVFVSAFAGSPDSGLAGAPAGVDSSGQIWRLRI